jgi:hypothetical protein
MECLPESAARVAASGAFGDMPLVVLSTGDATTAKTMEQEAVARLSSNGKIIVVPNSGDGSSKPRDGPKLELGR